MTSLCLQPLSRVTARGRLLCQTALLAILAAPFPAFAQEDENDVIPLIPIIIQSKLAYSGAIDGYLAPATETGVKSGVPLAEVPQSISVVTSTELEARTPRQVEDAIAYVPGVLSSIWGMDDRFDQFSIRGFATGPTAIYRDGLPKKALSFAGFSVDPYMIERIDVLRGPAGVLYGSNDAGGLVNLVTKRPVFERLAEGVLSYDSNGTAYVGFDWSDVINESGTLAARITGKIQDGETEVYNSANDRSFLAGGLTWAPTDDTSLTVLAHIQSDSLTSLIFAPVNGEDIEQSWGSVPNDFRYEQSDYNHLDTKQQSFGWEFTHNFNNALTFNHRLRYAHQTTDYAQLDFSSAEEEGLLYYPFRNDEEAYTLGLDNNVEWTHGLGSIENTLTVGADYQRSRYDVTQYIDYITSTVSYDDLSLDFDVTDPALSSKTRTTYVEKGIYIQDHLDFGQGTMVTAGLRHSRFDNETEDTLNDTDDSQDNSATTGMIGVTHNFANGLTPYLSYTEGFTPNVGTTIDGNVLDPSESTQWELGLRYAASNALMLSAAIFDLRKTNVKEYDLDDPTFSSFTQAGEVQSKGVEFEARGRLTSVLEGVVSYTHLETEVKESSDESLIGNENSFAPRDQATVWLDYDAGKIVPRLRIGGGLRYVSSYFATQSNGRVTPSYTLADLKVSYDLPQATVSLGVTNLFDKDYYGVCYDDYGCSQGEGRIVSLTLSRSF